ncbi:hypothetical protein RCL1_003560 [Eukaryota sp. TZLM3-RCL]
MTSRFNLSGEAPHFTPKKGVRPTSSTPEAPASTEVIPIVKQHPNETIYQMEISASVPTVSLPPAEAKKTNRFKFLIKHSKERIDSIAQCLSHRYHEELKITDENFKSMEK